MKDLKYDIRNQRNYRQVYPRVIDNLNVMIDHVDNHDLNYGKILYFFNINPTTQKFLMSSFATAIISIVGVFFKDLKINTD